MSEQQGHAEAIMQRARSSLAATDEALRTAGEYGFDQGTQ